MYMQTPYNPFSQVDDYPQQQQFGLAFPENPPTSIFGQMQNIASGHLGEPDLLNRAFRGNSDNDF
jgi:hypothetical protein